MPLLTTSRIVEDISSQNKDNQKNSENPEEKDHLPTELEQLISYIPEENRDEAKKLLSTFSIRTASSFSGPLPPPSLLKGYNEIITGGAERIMKMAEHQSNHRIELEKLAIREELKQSGRGQLFGFILSILGMCIAFFLAYLGHDTIAGIFGTTTIIGLVTVFVIGKRRQNKESD